MHDLDISDHIHRLLNSNKVEDNTDDSVMDDPDFVLINDLYQFIFSMTFF